MNDRLSDLESMVSAALANQQGPTAENIRELIGNLRQLPMFGSVTDDDAERLASVSKNVSASPNTSAPF